MFNRKIVAALACSNMPADVGLMNLASTAGHALQEEAERIDKLVRNDFTISVSLEHQVSELRLKTLSAGAGTKRPEPFTNPDLEGVCIDKNGLVDLAFFDQRCGGLAIGDSVFEMLPALGQRNSSYWTLQALNALPETVCPKIRLDPLMSSSREGYRAMIYRMRVFGKPLTWRKILALPNETTERWMPDDPDSSDVAFTDAVWTPRDDEIHLRCEECPKPLTASYRPARYFHTVIDRTTESIMHCDGALRIFSPDEARDRNDMHVRDAGKLGTRVKLFQIDGKLDSLTWTTLLKAFFLWNQDIEKFADKLAVG